MPIILATLASKLGGSKIRLTQAKNSPQPIKAGCSGTCLSSWLHINRIAVQASPGLNARSYPQNNCSKKGYLHKEIPTP
jgi:hypothetical protein